MIAREDDPGVNGAGIVKIVIIGLLLMLVGRKFGIELSVMGFVLAVGLAAILYAIWRWIKFLARNRHR